MKTVLVNGSPHAEGNTSSSLQIVAAELSRQGIETETVQIGDKNITGCIACGGCANGNGCVLADEEFAEIAAKIYGADAVVFGTPVYYAGINGTLKSFMDRLFYSAKQNFRHKIGAGVAIARRCGGMPAFEQLNTYFLITEMLIAPSFYWNIAYGRTPGEVLEDAEGVSVLQNLARNMAWMLKMKEATASTLPPPEPPADRPRTHFIR